jgi:hypothetical protein
MPLLNHYMYIILWWITLCTSPTAINSMSRPLSACGNYSDFTNGWSWLLRVRFRPNDQINEKANTKIDWVENKKLDNSPTKIHFPAPPHRGTCLFWKRFSI